MPREQLDQVEPWQPPNLGEKKESPHRGAASAKAQDFSLDTGYLAPEQTDVEPPIPATEAEDLFPEETHLPTLEQIEAIQQQAYEEGLERGRVQGFEQGFEQGRREALEQGRQQIAEQLQRFDALLRTLDTPFKVLDDQVERELLTLVVTMVRQLVRREVRTDPSQIVGVIREALAILPVSTRHIRVLLHPEDAEIVRKLYALEPEGQAWVIVEDPVVQRGGCRILSDTSQVDATLESRLHNLIAPLLGGLRSDDQIQEGQEDEG